MSDLKDFFGSEIAPPKASTTDEWVAGSFGTCFYGRSLPMTVTDNGEYLDMGTTTVKHYSNKAVLNWTFTILTSMGGAYVLSGIYWDRVDDKLYVLGVDATADTIQLGWVNTGSGAYTALGAGVAVNHDVCVALQTASYTTFRRAAQGSGDFAVVVTNATGMATFTVPIAGGSVADMDTNVSIGGCDPVVVSPFKIATDVYIGQIGCSARTGTDAYGASPYTTFNFATANGQRRYANANMPSGIALGIAAATGAPVDIVVIQDWGGDVCIWLASASTEHRYGPSLLDTADFNRWALEVIEAAGG